VSSPDANQVGKSLPNVAERSFSLQARYQWTDAFAIGGTASYASEINGGTVFATSTEIPDWWRGDLFAEYRFTAGLSARINVLNVTDETYFDTLYRSATPFVYIAPGRSALLTFEYEF
nr:TonB-dependent receptor [Pseudomonadales bacterium]